ncbi:hypothetical protein MN116_005278 [Schistosoma mekongi]|uniref:Peregrin n=1 Tax=Schistosoma mekongi TaxID=38744 RepID=A0AAE1ZEL6_SCHME|nr:hypothetical protein MN116_005278 [Schistosoma mekongi]
MKLRNKQMVYHPVDFDIDDFLSRIQGNKPPFVCPSETCQKVCRSYNYMQKHMLLHRPPTPIDIPGPVVNGNISAGFKCLSSLKNASDQTSKELILLSDTAKDFCQQQNRNSMVFTDAHSSVVFEASSATKGHTFRCNIYVPLTIRIQNAPNQIEEDPSMSIQAVSKPEGISINKKQTFGRSKILHHKNKGRIKNNKNGLVMGQSSDKQKYESCEKGSFHTSGVEVNSTIEIPKAVYSIDPEFSIRKSIRLKEGSSYIRFIEKTADELDEVVEYDLDEEDLFWLERINAKRKSLSLLPVTESTLEWVMDRFEKKARFRMSSSSGCETTDVYPDIGGNHSGIDDDAVCAVCQDGTCENTNVILFCDVCNLAVHQECYGVPYVPEGPWLCRKCLHSPSEPVSCVLCPNRGGAFKKTTDDRWAHVICGLWVPEVMFANLTFLEPLEGIDRIAPARWRLQCFICKQRNVGACIQCHKSSCYRAFHVTCAQHAGLYMKIEHTDDPGDSGIRKSAFCDQHCPPDHFSSSNKGMYAHSDSDGAQSPERVARIHLRKARKILAERRNSKPSVCVPIVSKAKMNLILSKLSGVSGDKMEFLKQTYAFWKLKREFRRGVPLLKRLQACSLHRSAANFAVAATTGDAESHQMRAHLKFWQQLRQDLERGRLLSELIRKRERIKRDIFRSFVKEIELKIKPFVVFQLRFIDKLQALDTNQFFAKPVEPSLAPDYALIIKNPMDFSTIRKKIENFDYITMDDLLSDFDLMLENCFEYNRETSIYYTAAVKLRERSKPIISEALALMKQINFCPKTGLLLENAQIKSEMTEQSSHQDNIENSSKTKENCTQSMNSINIDYGKNLIYTPVLLHVSSTKKSSNCSLTSERVHSPLKELINCGQNSSLPSNIRSRLRSFHSPTTTPNESPVSITTNGNFDFTSPTTAVSGGITTTTSTSKALDSTVLPRKRRLSSTSGDRKFLYSPALCDVDYRKSAKIARLNLHSPENAFAQAYTKSTNCFENLIKSPRINESANCKWNSSNNLVTSNGPTGLQVYQVTRSTNEMDGLASLSNGPAFTRYRIGRLSRGDDEDDEDDSEESDDDESDEGYIVYPNTNSSTPNHGHDSDRSHFRQQQHSKQELEFEANKKCVVNKTVTTTTVVGTSRMAFVNKRSPVSRLKSAYRLKAKQASMNTKNSKHKKGTLKEFTTNDNLRGTHFNTPSSVSILINDSRLTSDSDTLFTKFLPKTDTINSNNTQRVSDVIKNNITEPVDRLDHNGSSLDNELDTKANSCLTDPLSVSSNIEVSYSNNSRPIRSPLSRVSSRGSITEDMLSEHQFSPLDIVWAKCLGSPWYPAIIVDPDANEGYSHNGVPIPQPPESVLKWGKRIVCNKSTDDLELLLVLFFDTKRTWQWLSPQKLQPLGMNKELDCEKLREGRRSKMKHSVTKAYRRAVEHICKVHGRPYPYTDGKSTDIAVFTL